MATEEHPTGNKPGHRERYPERDGNLAPFTLNHNPQDTSRLRDRSTGTRSVPSSSECHRLVIVHGADVMDRIFPGQVNLDA